VQRLSNAHDKLQDEYEQLVVTDIGGSYYAYFKILTQTEENHGNSQSG
jgi:hypothetical protein